MTDRDAKQGSGTDMGRRANIAGTSSPSIEAIPAIRFETALVEHPGSALK